MAEVSFPRTRRDFVYILKKNEFNIPEAVNEVITLLNIEEELTDSVTSYMRIVQSNFKRAKKSLDQLNNDWWTSEIPWEAKPVKSSGPSGFLKTSAPSQTRKSLLNVSLQQQRSRLSFILEQLREVAVVENSSPVVIAALSLQLLANEEDNRQVANVAKEIVANGGFSNLKDKVVPLDKALFVLDLVGVGRRIYTQLRQTLIPENIIFPSYSKVADLRNILISRPSILLYPDPIQPIGVYTSYFLKVQQTLERILSTINLPASEEFPLTFRIADGLDGSGCHNIYNQQHTNTNTKNFILFCFKPISIHTESNTVVWRNNSPNSPFSQRPIFLCAAKECKDNIRKFMEDIINPDTAKLGTGVSLDRGLVVVDIIRSMFDGKMAAILSGSGGASCQMCTATHKDLKDKVLVVDGFPINRTITDARQLFSDIEDTESFFALPSSERFGLTDIPISTIDINSASPLHSYTCIFRWFNLLVYHLHIEKMSWSPTSPAIKQSMKFLQTLIQEKTGLKVDQPDSSGGTTSTGNVARRAFSNETSFLECVLSTIAISHRPALAKIHTQSV